MNLPNQVEILLVEDSAQDAELTIRALKKRNLTNKLTWLRDGAAALSLFFGPEPEASRGVSTSPKVVLLDLKLPKVDGLEVLRRLKSDSRTRSIPVVILTSSREESDLVRGYHLGANSYVVKPVDFEKFSEAVSQLGHYWLLLNQRPDSAAAPAPLDRPHD